MLAVSDVASAHTTMRVPKLVWLLVVLLVASFTGAAGPSPARAQTPPSSSRSESIPLFPLLDVVLFPNMSRPLHIFEPRYREMVADAVRGDGLIGMVLLQPGFASLYEGNPDVFDVGCIGEITEAEELADGRWLIVLEGRQRFRVVSEDHSRSYRVAEIEVLEEQFDQEARDALAGLRFELSDVFADLAPTAGLPPADLPDEDLVNGLAQFAELDPAERQVLIEAAGPLERAEALLDMLR